MSGERGGRGPEGEGRGRGLPALRKLGRRVGDWGKMERRGGRSGEV